MSWTDLSLRELIGKQQQVNGDLFLLIGSSKVSYNPNPWRRVGDKLEVNGDLWDYPDMWIDWDDVKEKDGLILIHIEVSSACGCSDSDLLALEKDKEL